MCSYMVIRGIEQTDSGRLTYNIRKTEYRYFRLLLYYIRSESQATQKITDLFIQPRGR